MKKKSTENSSQINRRDFVKSSAVVMGGLMASQLPLSASAYVTGADTIKIGLIGCGGRGTGAAVQALSTKQNIKLVA
ncbi:MAG: dehydrogenase, partial [Bacteroidetes bacterium]|nr:dehydrogenase [Bacteroidota bacterium]